ncbi:unnamed protein product [Ceratitis capitata]|uniref:(Mediterranean fruit fly) hypothetical protein n=1 Tax=Ceratitis capitata TaxID=7213 RepID=A0A811VCT8_CERCA|nr:unnamed protein product [Ceratitis capitata]
MRPRMPVHLLTRCGTPRDSLLLRRRCYCIRILALEGATHRAGLGGTFFRSGMRESIEALRTGAGGRRRGEGDDCGESTFEKSFAKF